jgi:cadmium resistance protein CadD (predicted permease)
MIETHRNQAGSFVGFLCLIGGALLTTLALTAMPAEWVNTSLFGAMLPGLLSAGLSATAVGRRA